MLKILINSYEIDFDGCIPYRMLNPAFNDAVSHSHNIKTINTNKNKDIINQLHLPESGYSECRFAGMIITDAFSFTGAIYFNSITDKYLDFQFNSQNDFWKLSEISLRSLDIPFDARYFPLKDSIFMDSFFTKNVYMGYLNGLNENGQPLLDDTTAPVPFLKLNSVIESLFSNFNINIKRNDLKQHADIDQLYMFNSNTNGKYEFPWLDPNWKMAFVTIDNGKYNFYSTKHGFADGTYLLVTYAYIRPIAVENQLFRRVFKITMIDEDNFTFDDEEALDVVLQGGPYSNYIDVIRSYYTGIISEESKNHLPEIAAGDFLKEIEKLTASRIFIDESAKECRIIFLKDIIKGNDVIDISDVAGNISEQSFDKKDGFKLSYENPSEDEYWSGRIKELTDLMTIRDPVATYNALPMTGNLNNDVRLVLDENCYYRYYEINFMRSSGWELYCENVLPMINGAGKLNVQTKFSPVLIQKADNFLFPCVEKRGQFMFINEAKYDDFRLFFYRGDFQYKNIHNNQVISPLCIIDVYDHKGDKIPSANLSLRWDSEYGLYNQLYKDYIDLMVNRYREETRFINWQEWMLNSFAWWKKYRINHMNYLVKSIDLELKPSATVMKNTVLIPV
jgi:hypothetical protein